MKDIMKSIGYEIVRSKMMIRLYILFIFVMGLIGVINVDLVQNGLGASGMLADSASVTYIFSSFVLALIVGIICGEDYLDKVANYEILFGHSRKSIFFARSLMGILVGAVLSTLLGFVPIITGSAVGGFGSSLVLTDVIARQLLFFFPFLRLGAFFAMLTFLVKNPYIIMAAGFVIGEAGQLFAEMFSHAKSYYVSIFNFNLLTDYVGWSIYNIDPTVGVVKYNAFNSSLSSQMVCGTIICSLLVTAFYLFMGYALFRRDELN